MSRPVLMFAAVLAVGCERPKAWKGTVRESAPPPIAKSPAPPSDFATNDPCPPPVPPAPPPLPGSPPASAVVPVSAVVPADPAPAAAAPSNPPEPPKPSKPAAGSDAVAVRKLVDAFAKRYAAVPDFQARLTKREVVGGKALPQDEILYQYRKEPASVYMKVLSDAGHGREVLFVKGKFDNKMHVVTGKGDNALVGAGFKTALDPDSKQATAKSRYRVYEAGFGRTLAGLTRTVEAMEKNQPGAAAKVLGAVERPEYPYPLECVAVTVRAGDEPQLPKGGTRKIFFDPKPESPGFMLPVLVVTTDADGREVEYYCFDQMKVPSGLTDADWTPDRLGGKKGR